MAIQMWFAVVVAGLLAALPGGVPVGDGPAGAGPAGGGSAGAGPAGGPGAGCSGTGAGARCWPVVGAGVRGRPVVLRAFEPPATPYAAGHRGVDLRAGPDTEVRAAAAGEVVFAGQVAGTGVLVLRIGADLRITYEPVRAAVPVGARVAAGQRVGTLAASPAHCPGGCLHWGLLRGDGYLDPLTLLPPWLRRAGPSRLLPVYGAAAGSVPAVTVRAGPSPRAAPW